MLTNRLLRLVVLCVSLGAVTACTSSLKVTTLGDAPVSGMRPEAEIRIYKADESAPPAYKILGKVYAYKRGGTIFSKPKDPSLMKMMRKPAAQMGADAIVGFRSSVFNGKEYNTIRRWASGLAVKLEGPAAFPQELQSDLLVVIAAPHFTRQQNAKNEAKFTKALFDAAQYHLEQKGYYAIIVQVPSQPFTEGKIDSMSVEALAAYGDGRAELILLISLNEVSSGHGLIAGTGDAELSVKLISKQTRRVVWENTAGGSTFSLGVINTLFQDRKKKAIYSAVKNVFETLTMRADEYIAER